MVSKSLCVAMLCLIPVSLTLANSKDWPQWRGPNQDNISTESGLLKAWPARGPELAWKATGLGAAFSSVSIVGDRIYTMGDIDGSSHALALELAGGKRIWKTKIGKAGAPGWGKFTGPRSTPTVDETRVFVLGQYGELACLEVGSGRKLWEKALTKDFGGKRPAWGYSESVLVDGNKLLCTPGGKQGAIIALNKETGATLWQSRAFTDAAHYSSIVCTEIGGVKQYIQLTSKSVAGVSTDGTLLWRADRKGKTAVIPTPIVKDKYVYVASGYGVGCNLFEITQANGAFTARQVYADKAMANQHGGVLLHDGHLYGFCDKAGWTCQDLATGKVLWSEKKQVGKGSLTFADGMLYLRSEAKGTVALIKATPTSYQETGRFVQPDFGKPKTWPHPVVVGKRLYLRDQDMLLCYDLAKK
jgi:outer membrane protein assembly factor BamB